MSHADDTAAAAAPALKIPPFTSSDICPWFQRVEAQFRICNVTSPTRRADHVIAALPPETFALLSPWISSKGTQAIQYAEIREQIIKRCVPTAEERSKHLMDLTRLHLTWASYLGSSLRELDK